MSTNDNKSKEINTEVNFDFLMKKRKRLDQKDIERIKRKSRIWRAISIICLIITIVSAIFVLKGEYRNYISVETEYIPYENADIGDYAFMNILYGVPIIRKSRVPRSQINRFNQSSAQNSYYYWAIDDSFNEGIIYVPSYQVEKFEELLNEPSDAIYVSGQLVDASSDLKQLDTSLDTNEIINLNAESQNDVSKYVKKLQEAKAAKETQKEELLEAAAKTGVLEVDLSNPKKHEEPSGMGISAWALIIGAAALIMTLVSNSQVEDVFKFL